MIGATPASIMTNLILSAEGVSRRWLGLEIRAGPDLTR